MSGFKVKKKGAVKSGLDAFQKKAERFEAEDLPDLQKERKPVGQRTVRLTMAIPQSLHTRLKLTAVYQKKSLVELVSGWIEQFAVVD